MSSTTAITGKDGEHVVGGTAIARMTQWNLTRTLASTAEWGDSDCNGYTARLAGRKDATFSSEGKFDTGAEVYDTFQPGDNASSVLWMTTTLYWDFPRSLCSDFNLVIDVDTEDVVGWTSSWGSDGVFYYPGQAGATSRSYP